MSRRFEPIPVRVRMGPLHIAVPMPQGYSTACGKRLRGAEPKPEGHWARGGHREGLRWVPDRRCPACDEIADHATNRQILNLIAGW